MTCTRCHGTRELYRQDCGAHGLTVPCPSCALDELIAGDADLYDLQRRGEYVPPMRTASARITGDKDRATQSSAPNEVQRLRTVLQWIADVAYVDHQSGNENFEYLQSVARDALEEPKP